MAYICNDCSNQSTKRSSDGKCPACDSYNMTSTSKPISATTQQKKPKTIIQFVILVLLWGFIAYGAWHHYFPHQESASKNKEVPIAIKANDSAFDF